MTTCSLASNSVTPVVLGTLPAGTNSAMRPSAMTTPRSAPSARIASGSLIQSAAPPLTATGSSCFEAADLIGGSLQAEHDILRALPERQLAECDQVLQPLRDRQEMIAGELADLAGERHRAVGQQNFGLADAARVDDDLARRRIAGVVLVSETEIEVAQRNPAAFAAPAHVD